jgi:DNA-binding CsgD family transcriptional regulator
MTRLGASQLRRLNRAVMALYEGVADAAPVELVIDAIEQLLPVSWVSVDEAAVGSRRVEHVGGRRVEVIPDIDAKIVQFCHQNPVVKRVLAGKFDPVLKISDFVTFRTMSETAFYREIACFMPGWRDQAAVALQLPGKLVGFGLNRDQTFTCEELLMLQLFQPHVERILSRCITEHALAATPSLTPKERETLHWVAEGKRDSEIARILSVSVRTVEQHVAACLRKLNVETRAAAAAELWRARLGSRSSTSWHK